MKNILVIYNTCGFGRKEPVQLYINNISSILNQDYPNFKLVWSSCFNSQPAINFVNEHFDNKLNINVINENLAVNQTFNHSVIKSVEVFGEFDGYMYIAGDVNFTDDRESLSRLVKRLEDEETGIVSPEIDNDNGYYWWFNFQEGKRLFDVFDSSKDFVVPLGATANLHAKIFSSKIYKEYGNVLPDVFVSYCTETIFSFLVAAIRQKFIITNDVIMNHRTNQIHSPEGNCQIYGGQWDRLFPTAKRSITEILSDPLASEVGLGYEEWVYYYKNKINVPNDKPFLIHNQSKFDSRNFSLNDNLKKFIKDNFYLDKTQLDYSKINSIFIKGK